MCLISNQKTFLIAPIDLVCYKVIKIDPNRPNYWRGLYYSDNEFLLGKKLRALGKPDVYKSPISGHTIVEGGFFHAATTEDWALNILDSEEDINTPNLKLVKCVIPKNSNYYLSHNGLEICSDYMIVGKDSITHHSCISYLRTKFIKLLNIFK